MRDVINHHLQNQKCFTVLVFISNVVSFAPSFRLPSSKSSMYTWWRFILISIIFIPTSISVFKGVLATDLLEDNNFSKIEHCLLMNLILEIVSRPRKGKISFQSCNMVQMIAFKTWPQIEEQKKKKKTSSALLSFLGFFIFNFLIFLFEKKPLLSCSSFAAGGFASPHT